MNEDKLFENLSQHISLAIGTVPTYFHVYQEHVMKDLKSNLFHLSHIIKIAKCFSIMNLLQHQTRDFVQLWTQHAQNM